MAVKYNYTNGQKVSGTSNANSIYNFGSKVTISSGKGNDSIVSAGDNVSISGGAGNDSIKNWDDIALLNGGSGNDIIENCGANSTIIAGAGKDSMYTQDTSTITAGKGNDTVGFNTAGDDDATLTYNYATGDGRSVFLKIGRGSININHLYGESVKVKDSTGEIRTIRKGWRINSKDNSSITANEEVAFIKNYGDNSTVFGSLGNDSIYNSGSYAKIYGNSGDDSIENGKWGINSTLDGGAGNDSLWGGSGNDSLWGGSGKDTFIYSGDDGKDVIYGFADNDMLKITGAFSATYSKSKDEVYFKVGTTSKAITLSDFSASSFNINGDIYQINGSKLVKK